MSDKFILEDRYFSESSFKKIKPIEYIIGGDNNDCFICVSHAQNPNKYFKIKRYGKSVDLHTWIYKVFNGEIHSDMVVRHICDNRECINPNHLILGTYRENSNDLVRSGKKKKRIDVDTVKKIKKCLSDGNMKQYEIAKLYDVEPLEVSRIKTGARWSHIDA